MELPPDKQKWIDIAIATGLTEQEGEESYIHFGANGWKRRNRIEIETWEQVPFVLQYWRNHRQDFPKDNIRLKPITGRTCSKRGCKMPAYYKDVSGDYDEYYCDKHMPDEVKKRYCRG